MGVGSPPASVDAALELLDAYIARIARRYFGRNREDTLDAIQEGKITAIQALRSWRPESGAEWKTHCMRNIWWRIHALARKEFAGNGPYRISTFGEIRQGKYAELDGGRDELREFRDAAALDAERALLALEIFESLTPAQQSAVERRYQEVVRGQPTREYQDARVAAQRFVRAS